MKLAWHQGVALAAGAVGLIACAPDQVVERPTLPSARPIAAEPSSSVSEVTAAKLPPPVTATEKAVRISQPPATLVVHELSVWELDATYNARQCIIDRESREAGMYTAENAVSSASGAYQWLDSSWVNYLPWAEAFYGLFLTSPEEEWQGARSHAAYASPYTQDLVTAFALLHRDLAQNQKPWPYTTCWGLIGSEKQLRFDGPEFGPTAFVQAQIV